MADTKKHAAGSVEQRCLIWLQSRQVLGYPAISLPQKMLTAKDYVIVAQNNQAMIMEAMPRSTDTHRPFTTSINRLVRALQPELIFCRNHHLLVVLPDHSAISLKEYQKRLKACRLPKRFSYVLLFNGELERQYRLGDLFTTTFCVPANCIYNSKNAAILPFWQRLQTIRETAILNFNAGIDRAKAFFQGACFYWAASDCNMAAFMLHQACELCLRAVVMAFTGEQVRTHILAEQMQHVKKYLPELATFFNNKTEKENRLLGLLEKAYSQTRYTYHYEISASDLLRLLQKIGQLHQSVEQLMRQTLSLYPAHDLSAKAGLVP